MVQILGQRFVRRDMLKFAAFLPITSFACSETYGAVSSRSAAGLVRHFVETNRVDALSVGVIRNGSPRFYNEGETVRGTGARASEHSVYEIGSVSKTFTALILANAVVEGRVRMADDIRLYLPAGYSNLERDGRAIRLADIVTTTSALPDNIPDWRIILRGAQPATIPFQVAALFESYSKEKFLADLAHLSLVDAPGAVPRHSNVASILLGIVLERVYGRPYTELLAHYIERPLHLRAGAGSVPSSLLAAGYDGVAMPRNTMAWRAPAGGLRYSTTDLVRYLQAHITARQRAIVLTQQPLWGSIDDEAIGFHWVIQKASDGQIFYSHSGSTFGFASYCAFYPSERLGLALLTNRNAPEMEARLQQLADALRFAA
jgi:D-alanyl-D-alanine-carboxypeptidase/D-alanyl-D-alanine-endopeptidase